jgi:hypothetical protein
MDVQCDWLHKSGTVVESTDLCVSLHAFTIVVAEVTDVFMVTERNFVKCCQRFDRKSCLHIQGDKLEFRSMLKH